MKRYTIGLVLVAALIGLWPGSGFTQSKEAREVCRRVNPAGAWRECMRQYDQERNKLLMDPKWQADQRQRREQRRLQEQALQQQRRLQERALQQQRQALALQIQILRQQQQNQWQLQKIQNALRSLELNGGSGLDFMCKEAISRGDRGGIFVHCN